MKTMNALLKLQEKNLLKYVMFILLTTLLNHDYAIRHVIFYHEWICSRLPIVLKTQWICFRERTYSNDIHSVLSSHPKIYSRHHNLGLNSAGIGIAFAEREAGIAVPIPGREGAGQS